MDRGLGSLKSPFLLLVLKGFFYVPAKLEALFICVERKKAWAYPAGVGYPDILDKG